MEESISPQSVTAGSSFSEEMADAAFLVRNTRNMVVFTDAGGGITWVNDAFVAVSGYTLGEVRGKSLSFLHGIYTDQETIVRIRKAFQEEQRVEEKVLNYAKDGRPYLVSMEIIPRHNREGILEGFLAIHHDITECCDHEKDLENLRTIVDQSDTLILITDSAWKITYVNRAFERITGYAAAEVVGRNPRILKSGSHGENFYKEIYSTIVRGGHLEGLFS